MLGHLLHHGHLDRAAFINAVYRPVGPGQANRTLPQPLSSQRLGVLPRNSPRLLEAVLFDEPHPAQELVNHMPRHLAELFEGKLGKLNSIDHIDNGTPD